MYHLAVWPTASCAVDDAVQSSCVLHCQADMSLYSCVGMDGCTCCVVQGRRMCVAGQSALYQSLLQDSWQWH